ncbi:MAG: TIGR02300 family protein [Pseudomonadota bacterium]
MISVAASGDDPRGTKRTCTACGVRFYDLARTPAVCPDCQFELPPVASRAAMGRGNSAFSRFKSSQASSAPGIKGPEEDPISAGANAGTSSKEEEAPHSEIGDEDAQEAQALSEADDDTLLESETDADADEELLTGTKNAGRSETH